MEGKIETRNNVQGVLFCQEWIKLHTENANLKDNDWVTFSAALMTEKGLLVETMTTGKETDVAIHVKKNVKVPPTLYPQIYEDGKVLDDGIYLVVFANGTTQKVTKDSIFGFDGTEEVEYYYLPKLS